MTIFNHVTNEQTITDSEIDRLISELNSDEMPKETAERLYQLYDSVNYRAALFKLIQIDQKMKLDSARLYAGSKELLKSVQAYESGKSAVNKAHLLTLASEMKRELNRLRRNSTLAQKIKIAITQQLNLMKQRSLDVSEIIASKVADDAQKRCPKRTGALAASLRVDIYSNGFAIGFYQPYAMYVHENMEIKHPVHIHNGVEYDCGGEAKFLWNAIASLGITPNVVILPEGYIEAYISIDDGPDGMILKSLSSREGLVNE